MTDNLVVQAGHIRVVRPGADVFANVASACGALLRPVDESIYLFWNQIPLRVRYAQDFVRSIDDYIAFAWLIFSRDTGEIAVTLQSQWLTLSLDCRWRDDEVELVCKAAPIEQAFEEYATAIGRRPRIKIKKLDLLRELKTLLCQLDRCLQVAEITIEGGTEARKRDLLTQMCRGIEGYGALYGR